MIVRTAPRTHAQLLRELRHFSLRFGEEMLTHRRRGTGGLVGRGGAIGNGYTPTHYVAPFSQVSGATNDYTDMGATAYTNAANPLTPTTLFTALSRASAGHVVQSAPGVYLKPMTDDRNSPTWKPLVSGADGNPIIFTAQYPAAYNRSNTALMSKLWFTDPSSEFNVLVGVGGHDGAANHDIVWDGFWCEATETYPHGGNGIVSTGIGIDSNQPTRVWYRRFYIQPFTQSSANNYDCFQCRAADAVTIEDCYMYGNTGHGQTSRNNAGYKGYGCTSLVIRYNTFENLVCGIFFKGKTGVTGNTGSIYRNRFVGITGTVFDIAESQASGSTDIYENLAYGFAGGDTLAMHWDVEAGSSLCQNITVRHNTFVTETTSSAHGGFEQIDGSVLALTNCVQRDNILATINGGYASQWFNAGNAGASQAAALTLNYDWLFNNGDAIVYAFDGVGSLNLAAFQSASGWYANVSVGSPNFVDAGANNYRIASGSALTASSTGGQVGAYVSGDSIEHGIRTNPSY